MIPAFKRILYVAYPLLTVSECSAGGAEQMLWALEREIAGHGVPTTVAASAGSQVSGELFITGEPCIILDDFERRNLEHQDRIVELIHERAREGRPFDLVHDQSGSFWPLAAEIDFPVLATLHLPRHFYPPHFFENVPANVSFNCVSGAQAPTFVDLNPTVVPNGILLDRFAPNSGPRSGLLWLGRICEEKAPHLALEIARRADEPVNLAGQIYPFSYHQEYFDSEVGPRLEHMPSAAFVSSPSAGQKRRFLRECKAVIITSLVDETSSLVAMEAAASGTPVITFRRGALPEIVVDGVTGFLVDGVEEAVEALKRIEEIVLSDCVSHARENFSGVKMAEGYAQLYHGIAAARNTYAET
ncbi:MAG TPA: glycosyltransferase [Candidatus Angelobacter sp.]|nr:glycosyltransferase [Candidatus Angelobacter sp.]